MNALNEFWPILKGTADENLVLISGKILIQNGYWNWAFRWLLEKYLIHPTSEQIIFLLTKCSSELLDYSRIRLCGELGLSTGKTNLQSVERLLVALLANGEVSRCEEILERIEDNRKSTKMLEIEIRLHFYESQNFHKVVKLYKRIPKHRLSSEIVCHAGLAYHSLKEIAQATNVLQTLVDDNDPNACMTMYEILREKSPKHALKVLNKLLSHHGWAEFSEEWMNQSFQLDKISCKKYIFSEDSRLISVVMTTHRKNKMMDAAVNSILNQSHRNIELLIVDDCSPKEDEEYYQSIVDKDSRVRVIRQEENKGTYSGRNRGLSEVSGDYVMFVDSDDWSHPQRIENSLKILDENPNCIFATECYTRLNFLGELTLSGGFFVRRCMLGLWRTEIIRDELGGFDNVRVGADAEVFERAQKRYGNNSISTLRIPTYFAYSHEKSLTGGGEFSINWRGVSEKRAAYAGTFRSWHKKLGDEISVTKLDSNLESPPFRMPIGLNRTVEYPLESYKYHERFIKIHNDLRFSAVDELTQPLTPVNSDTTNPKVTICMATFPKRFNQIGKTVKFLLDQTKPPDKILIHVNESSKAPVLPNDSRIEVHLSPNENLTDIGKIKMVDFAEPGIIILADDDLHYPKDYVEKMVSHVQRYNGEACVGTHGIVFPINRDITDIDQYFSSRRVHHFKRGLSIDLPCHALGTGTMAFDSRKINFNWENWKYGKMVDLHVAVDNQRNGVQMVIVPRKANWIKSFSEEPDDVSIWKEVKSNYELQSNMIKVISVVKNWILFLSGSRRISNEDLLKSDINDMSIHKFELPSDYVRFAGAGGYEPLERWSQKGRILYFETTKRTIQFCMPTGWKLEDTHPDLFHLAHYVLMYPFENGILDNWKPTRTPGWRPGLSFSGGIDSTACLELMPRNTVALYHERKGFRSILNHTNANLILDDLQRSGITVFKIPSDHELIRTDYGKSVGFSSDFSAGVHVILMADYLNLDSIGFGLPLENAYLFHGHKGRNFMETNYWKRFSKLFSSCGLDLFFPSAGLSELINLKIVNDLPHGDLAQSCLRSRKPKEVCGICWKCFRKNSMRGEEIILSDEVNTFLSKTPLKQAASTIYAINRLKENDKNMIVDKFPLIGNLLKEDFSFLERYHPDSQLFVPTQYRKQYMSKLDSNFRPMTKKQVNRLVNLVLFE